MLKWTVKAGATDLNGLVLENGPVPQPAPGQVRVRVRAASLNYRDHLVLTGSGFGRREREIIPVSDAAGVIDAVGERVTNWRTGDPVVTVFMRGWMDGPPPADMGVGLGGGSEDGVLAEYIVLSADRVTRAPATLDDYQAATLPCAGLTAWSALQGAHPIGKDSRVLVLGSGGVSTFALSLAQALGAEVLATTSRDDKRERLLAMGAREVVNYRRVEAWGEEVFSLTGGIDKVVNAAGLGSLTQSMAACRAGGEVAVMGLMTSGDPVDPLLLMGRNLNIRGTSVGSVKAFRELIDTVDELSVKPMIDKVFPFKEARAAYKAQISPDLFGKVVISGAE